MRPNQETGGRTPPDHWHADEIGLGLMVAPPAQPQAEPRQRLICRRGREDFLFFRVRNQHFVRRHHRDRQVPEVAQERRTVVLGLTGWYCRSL